MLVLLLAYEGVFADPSFSWPTRPIGKQPKHMARLEVWVEENLLFGAEFISRKDKPYWLHWSFRRCPFRNLSIGKRRRWLVNKMRAYFPSYSKLGVNHYLNRSLARGTWMSQDVSKWFVNGLYRLRSIYGDEILPSFMGIIIRHHFWILMNRNNQYSMECHVWVLNVAHLEYFQTSLCFNLHREPSEGWAPQAWSPSSNDKLYESWCLQAGPEPIVVNRVILTHYKWPNIDGHDSYKWSWWFHPD